MSSGPEKPRDRAAGLGEAAGSDPRDRAAGLGEAAGSDPRDRAAASDAAASSNESFDPRDRAAALAAAGDYAAAIELLEDALGSSPADTPVWRETCADAIDLCARVSWHERGLAHAARLEAALGLPRYRAWRVRTGALLAAAGFAAGSAWLAKFLLSLGLFVAGSSSAERPSWRALRSLQFAHFWSNIERSAGFALQQLGAARNDEERLASYAWLGYAMAYRGYSPFSTAVIRKVLKEAHALRLRGLLADVYPLLGIAFFMQGRSRKAHACFDFYDRCFKDGPEFYRLLILTARINLNMADGRLIDAERDIGRCFSYAFAMQKSRHHIQIYGASAALAAVEERHEQALSYLQKAAEAAETTDNHLDWLIFYRYAALVHMNLGDRPRAQEALVGFARHHAAYGSPLWYGCQLLRMRTAVRPGAWRLRGAATDYARMLAQAARSVNPAFLLRLLRDGRVHLFVRRGRYWAWPSIAAFLRHRLAATSDYSKDRQIAALSDRISEALLSPEATSRLDAGDKIGGLLDLLRRTFPAEYVGTAPNIKALLDDVRAIADTTGFPMIDDRARTIRMPCSGGRFLLGINVPKADGVDPDLAVGVLLSGLDLASVPFAEATLKLLVTDFSHLRALDGLRARERRDRELVGVGQAAQMLAHDVRRPFSVVLSGLKTLGAQPDPAELRRGMTRLCAEVERSVTRVNAMIADVVAAAAPVATPAREPVWCEQLIEAAMAEVFGAFPDCRMTISYDLAAERPLLVDPVQVGRGLANILANAVQASKGAGRLWFRAREVAGAMIEVTIGNDGSSIPPAALAAVFEPFYTSGKRGGTGLGLAIAHKVITAHGGAISCRSGADDVEFVFTLPSGPAAARPTVRLPARSLPPPPPAKTPPAPLSGVVALLDDDPFILEAWTGALKGAGPEIRPFASGEAFFTALGQEPALLAELGCVVTDFDFGPNRLTGLDVLDRLRSTDRSLPVLLSSDGEFDETTRRRFDRVLGKLGVEANALMFKPVAGFSAPHCSV